MLRRFFNDLLFQPTDGETDRMSSIVAWTLVLFLFVALILAAVFAHASTTEFFG